MAECGGHDHCVRVDLLDAVVAVQRLLGVALREGEAKAALAEAQASRDEASKIEKEIRGRLDRLNKAAAA